jgi:hypothetical protein
VYPVWSAVSLLAVAGLRWPEGWDPWVVWLLPLPAAIEWWLEHLGRLEYSPGRNVAVSVLAAVGVGVAFARYLEHPTDPLFWAVVLTYGIASVVGALWGSHRGRGTAPTTSDPPAGSAGISSSAGFSSSAEPSGTAAGRAR